MEDNLYGIQNQSSFRIMELSVVLNEPRDGQHAAFDVHLGQLEPTRFQHTQPVAKHQQQQAPVTGRVAGTLDGRYGLINFGRNQGFSVVHHFV
jgi:hypothetical protein